MLKRPVIKLQDQLVEQGVDTVIAAGFELLDQL